MGARCPPVVGARSHTRVLQPRAAPRGRGCGGEPTAPILLPGTPRPAPPSLPAADTHLANRGCVAAQLRSQGGKSRWIQFSLCQLDPGVGQGGNALICSRGLSSGCPYLPGWLRNPRSSRGIRGFVRQNPAAGGGRAPPLLEEMRGLRTAEKAEVTKVGSWSQIPVGKGLDEQERPRKQHR